VSGPEFDQPADASTPKPTRGGDLPTGPAGQRPIQPTLRRSRIGTTRLALIASAVVLVLLLVFIVQNGHSVKVSYLGASGHMPLAVAMLFAAVAGALLLAIPGTARIVQLRRAARRQHRDDVR
jgi:lipopolysaccharide assembly protein A